MKGVTARPDAEVITASIARPAEFGAIFERHFAVIHAYLARRVGRDGADDLVSDVFTIAFAARERFDPAVDTARPWLFGIATHLVARWYRSAERRDRAYERSLAAGVPFTTDNAYALADDRIDAATKARLLGVALDTLADGDRDALLLYAWEGLSYAEIALALNVPVGTVRSRLFRARRTVGELLEPCGQLPGDSIEGGGRRG
jgi:RNA polymerase sigma factor (sigma-70 family)